MADGTIFINYRRDDSRADAGRLYDRLQGRYPGRIFRDVGSLGPGIEWHDAIAKVLGTADACIVVIGRNWLGVTDSTGKRRLDDPRDTVRQEILTEEVQEGGALNAGADVFEETPPGERQGVCEKVILHECSGSPRMKEWGYEQG